MKKQFVIYGDSPFAERLYSYIRQEDMIKVLGFTNDDGFMTRTEIQGRKVYSFSSFVRYMKDDCELILAYGYSRMNDLREKIYNECVKAGCRIGTYISSHVISYSDQIGEGSIILPGVLIGPGTVIGKCNCIEAACVFSHDSIVGDFNYFSSGVVMGGYSRIGNHCFLGLNSTIRNGISLADYTLIGAASNLLISTDEYGVYVGNPGRCLPQKSVDTVL
ncbi:MAG: acetyltransferase [Bacteroidales bacterium]|nr:acetyltransferase [Fibrobacter sp.]MBR3387229.1 acetyltransferase [Bacteroidales bacterium]